jgi:tripartite-type tricarboxylate transporter receptor subunit TctC
MNKYLNRLLVASVVSCAALTTANAAYPDKTVSVVVPWAPGGSTDILARMLSTSVTPILLKFVNLLKFSRNA